MTNLASCLLLVDFLFIEIGENQSENKCLFRRANLLIHPQASLPQARHQRFTYGSMSWKAARALLLGSSRGIAEAEWLVDVKYLFVCFLEIDL